MGCLCARGREYSDSKEVTKSQQAGKLPVTPGYVCAPLQQEGTGNRSKKRGSALKMQLTLPVESGDRASSPRGNRSNPQTPSGNGHLRVNSSGGSSRSGGSTKGRRGSASWAEVSVAVRLKDCRVLYEGLKSYYLLQEETIGRLVKAELRGTVRKCWIQTYEVPQDKSIKEVKQQLGLLKSLNHPNILRMLELLQDGRHLYAVYEDIGSRTVEALCEKTEGVSEQWAVAIMRQVFSVGSYCQSKGLVLNSLSPRQILLVASPTEDYISVKLLLSLEDCIEKKFVDRKQEVCEYLRNCGIVLSTLLTGKCVLENHQSSNVSKQLLPAYWKWQEVNKEAKALTLALLSKNYRKQPSLAECLQHPWLATHTKPALSPTLRCALRNLAKLRPVPSLKKAFLQLMLSLIVSPEELREVRQAFLELDTDMDGTVTEEELRIQLLRLFPEEQAHTALTAITSTAVFSAERELGYSEFLLWACSRQILSADSLTSAFQLLDRDKDGKVTYKDLREFLCLDCEDSSDPSAWQMLFATISSGSEETFYLEEFRHFMLKH